MLLFLQEMWTKAKTMLDWHMSIYIWRCCYFLQFCLILRTLKTWVDFYDVKKNELPCAPLPSRSLSSSQDGISGVILLFYWKEKSRVLGKRALVLSTDKLLLNSCFQFSVTLWKFIEVAQFHKKRFNFLLWLFANVLDKWAWVEYVGSSVISPASLARMARGVLSRVFIAVALFLFNKSTISYA